MQSNQIILNEISKPILREVIRAWMPPEEISIPEWIETNVNLTGQSCAFPGRLQISRTPYTRGILEAFADYFIEHMVLCWGRQLGKCLWIETAIPTSVGWKKIGGIKKGDIIFDENGQPCHVINAFSDQIGKKCFQISFSDGSTIISDADHLWKVRRRRKSKPHDWVVISTADMEKDYLPKFKKQAHKYSIQVADPLVLPKKYLPIPPYTLGVWLGDGHNYSSNVTIHRDDWQIIQEISKDKIPVHISQGRGDVLEVTLKPLLSKGACGRGHSQLLFRKSTIAGGKRHFFCGECERLRYHGELEKHPGKYLTFYTMLKKQNLLKNKHVPKEYLRASYDQRLALLQGLMDTDGSHSEICEFSNSNRQLAYDVFELIKTLGFNPKIKEKRAVLNGKDYGISYRITFTAYLEQAKVFRLDRKWKKQPSLNDPRARPEQVLNRFIIGIKEIDSVPVRCIEVDSPSHLYLAGESFIPTHNTEGVQIPALCFVIANDPGPAVFFLPTERKCRDVEAIKVEPILAACAPVVAQKTANADEYTMLKKKFKEMTLSFAWAGSATEATTRSTRYLLRDEIDEFESAVGPDATSPMKAIEQTTSAFPNRKIIDTSTPTIVAGNIWQALKSCRYVFEFWIPCPHCGEKQILYWGTKDSTGGIKWDGETDPVAAENIAYYQCEHCPGKITNHDKIRMLLLGQWRARLTPDPCEQIMKDIPPQFEDTISLEEVLIKRLSTKIGFHLPKWYGAFDGNSFGEAVKDFLEADRALNEGTGYILMRDWKKFWAARPWEEEKIPETELELLSNKIDIPALVCPPDTLFLTCGIDPSEGKYWFVVKAWMLNREHRGFTGHLLHYGTLSEFNDVEDFLKNATYPVLDKPDIRKPIIISGLDTGGGRDPDEEADFTMTAQAYDWLRKVGRAGLLVMGTKGVSHPIKNAVVRQSKIEKYPGKNGPPIPGGLHIWEIDTDQMKRNLWFHLRIEEGQPGRFTFHSGTDFDYIKHLLSERLIRDKKGKEVWKRRSKNHWLDATIIANTLVQNDCYGLRLIRMSQQPKSEEKKDSMPAVNPITQKPRGGWSGGWRK